MTGQPYRLAGGGLIDRGRPISFSFNGRQMQGFVGDTVASALLANGVRIVARSFKYHRPRGIYAVGVEEPGALLEIHRGNVAEPNARASQVPLEEGMRITSQNHWPSLGLDLLRVNDLLSPVFSAGFYNKTFKWPRRFWPLYERVLRNIAGLGRAPSKRDDRHYEQVFGHCDVLIVGAGPAGLSAALALAGQSLRVLLVDERAEPGGWLLRERCTVDGADGSQWVAEAQARLESSANVELMTTTTAFGYYDHNLVALCEQRPGGIERLWRVRAAAVILATGAIERPLVFPNNDLPGVMLAGAARAFINQYAVKPGERAVIYTSNDSAYRTAADLSDADVRVQAIVDTRPGPGGQAANIAADRSIPLYTNGRLEAIGRRVLRSARVRHDGAPGALRLDCNLLCVSGGWTPTVHLHAQSGGSSVYLESLDAFVPDTPKQQSVPAGAINGLHGIRDCLADGRRAAFEAARLAGNGLPDTDPPVDAVLDVDVAPEIAPQPVRFERGGKQFVDLQNDVTTKDVQQAHRENYVSVEHLKRYTTLGMGTDQGKTSNLNGLNLLAELRAEPVPRVGTTTFRPPYTPVSLGAVAGCLKDAALHPTRRTVMHELHAAAGARFDFNGLWIRPQCYPQPGETADDAICREALAVRQKAGITDISTLGKFEIKGTDCVEFLNRVYVNDFDRLAVGRARYALMLRDDGMVLDDGTVTRIGGDHFFITTSSGHAGHVLQHMEYLLDVAWPELDVNLVSVTEQWAGVALAGPESRAILHALGGADDARIESL
ncbi:MAG: 2Fe-2S iron-sulfur cluster-binding protein, partial [Gammaproteobacteria bacterium]|nr:2Fe-2S iron-sulfur cluster-binding protein [Gammaproteobacteria bacterium]